MVRGGWLAHDTCGGHFVASSTWPGQRSTWNSGIECISQEAPMSFHEDLGPLCVAISHVRWDLAPKTSPCSQPFSLEPPPCSSQPFQLKYTWSFATAIMKSTMHKRLLRRSIGEQPSKGTRVKDFYSDRTWVDDLDIINELGGHSGCVNALRLVMNWSFFHAAF